MFDERTGTANLREICMPDVAAAANISQNIRRMLYAALSSESDFL
jgi:hypothetical protein